MAKILEKSHILRAFECLDPKLDRPAKFVVGGGGALVAVYGFPLATEDVDAFTVDLPIADLARWVDEVARELRLPHDWLNAYFSTFAFVLPSDYGSRLRPLFKGKNCEAWALGPEDLLLMKCFAARDKDIPHARALLKISGIDLGLVEDRINELIEKKVKGSAKALEFFDDITADL